MIRFRQIAVSSLIAGWVVALAGLLGAWTHGAQTPTYDGLSSTRAQVNTFQTFDTTNKQLMVRSTHVTRSAITQIKIIASNFYVDQTTRAETAPGAAATVTASIEYPSGTCTPLLFSSSSSGTIADGSTLTSDYATVAIPAGVQYWVRQYLTSTAGAIYNNVAPQITGDILRKAASGLVDQTVSCGVIAGGGGGMHFPLAIISPITVPSVCITGDSIGWGTGDTPTSNGDQGIVARSIGPAFGYSNLAVPSDAAYFFLASHTQRVKVFPFCTHFINEYGTNDFAAGHSLATVKADLTSIYNLYPNSRVFQTTILPRPTTSNGCTTLGGQTLPSWEASRVSLDDQLRLNTFGPPLGSFDTASPVETALNSGFWITSPQQSADCVHPNSTGYGTVTSSGAIDTSRIHLP